MLTFGSTLGNVASQDLRVLALVGAVGVGTLEDLVVASAGAWLRMNASQVVLEIWVLIEALEEVAGCSRLAWRAMMGLKAGVPCSSNRGDGAQRSV